MYYILGIEGGKPKKLEPYVERFEKEFGKVIHWEPIGLILSPINIDWEAVVLVFLKDNVFEVPDHVVFKGRGMYYVYLETSGECL